MTDTLMIIGAWYFSGLIGSALALEFGFRRSRHTPLDVTVCDLFLGATIALCGPISFIAGVCYTIAWLIGGTLRHVSKGRIDSETVVFRAHERRRHL